MIKFSDKYLPLFDLLNGVYPEVDTVLISGGRDSGKTFAITCFVPIAAADYNHRVLFTRQTMSSTDRSITSALDNRLELLGLESDFDFANNDYKCKNNPGLISITGQKTSVGTQTAKLKSLENYSIFITEEGEELTSLEEWKKVKRSIRAKDVQCLSMIVFNPPTKAHWMYEQWYKNVPDGFNGIVGKTMYIHTDYIDNGKENMALPNWEDYESLRVLYEQYLATHKDLRADLPKKIIHAYKEYKNIVKGAFRDIAEGVVFEYEIGEFVKSEYDDVFGMDVGYNDSTAVVRVNVDKKNKKIYLDEIFYKSNQIPDTIVEAIKPIVGTKRIWCDSQAKMFIQDLKNRGLNIKPCEKPKIRDSIMSILNYEIIVTPESKNLIFELNNYKWADNKKDEPIDAYNHAIDAFRYAAIIKITRKTPMPL
jgi:phage terminase large subunit